MKKLFFLLFVSIGFASTSFAQSGLKEQADKFAAHSLKGEVEELVTYFHPTIIEEMGGEERVKELLGANNYRLKHDGVQILSHEIGAPVQEVKTATTYYALVPQYVIMKTGESKFKVETYLLAISESEAPFKFVNVGNYSATKMAEFFPDLKGQLNIPEKQFKTVD